MAILLDLPLLRVQWEGDIKKTEVTEFDVVYEPESNTAVASHFGKEKILKMFLEKIDLYFCYLHPIQFQELLQPAYKREN